MKKTVVKALLTFFSGVLIIRQSRDFGLSKSSINVALIDADVMSCIRSAGVLPLLSLMSLGAPLISNARTGLVDNRVSTDFTARCNGV